MGDEFDVKATLPLLQLLDLVEASKYEITLIKSLKIQFL